jgi:hypothetical protein
MRWSRFSRGVPPFCTGLVKRSGGKSAVWVMKPHRECPVCAGSNSVFIGNRFGRSIIYLKQIERAVLLSFLLGEPRNGCRADVVADEERRASTYRRSQNKRKKMMKWCVRGFGYGISAVIILLLIISCKQESKPALGLHP